MSLQQGGRLLQRFARDGSPLVAPLARGRPDNAALADRSSRPHRQPRPLNAADEEAILRARRETNLGQGRLTGIIPRARSTDLEGAPTPRRLTASARASAKATAATSGRGLARHCTWTSRGSPVSTRPATASGKHATGARTEVQAYDYLHCVVDDHSRLAYIELHPREDAETNARTLERALRFFAEFGLDPTASCLAVVQPARRHPRGLLRLAAARPVAASTGRCRARLADQARLCRVARELWGTARACRAARVARDRGWPQGRRPLDAPARAGRRLAARQAAAHNGPRPGGCAGAGPRRAPLHCRLPNELWLAGITHLPTREGWLFLAVVLDAYSRRIVGWSMRDDLKTELVVEALGMAVTRHKPPAGVVHHSDRGSQYTPRSPSARRCASPAW